MSCINYNVYRWLYTDHQGRIALTSPVPRTICEEPYPYPPPNSLCEPGETIRYYFANLLRGQGMVICDQIRRR